MKTMTLIALFFAASIASAQVTFHSSEIAVQMSWSEIATYETSIHAQSGQSTTSDVNHSVTREKTCKVLDVDNAGRIDAVHVTYDSASNGDVSGRSYVVTPRDVSYAAGGAPSGDELRFVRSDNASFGQFRALDRIFGGKTFTIGQSFEPNKNDAEELVNIAAGTQLKAMALTLRSVANGVATFDLSMTIESDPKEKKSGKMTLVLDGQLDVTIATSRPVRLEASGPIQARTNKSDGSRAGTATGDVTIRRTYDF